MRCGRAANQADRHRQFDAAAQVARSSFLPAREGAVALLPATVAVRARLYGAPVVAGRDDHRVNPVHDTLVVRRDAERVGARERIGSDAAVHDLCAAEEFRRPGRGRPALAVHRQDGDNSQVDPPAGKRLEPRCDRLRHRVHRVSAHRVTAVDQQVRNHHRPSRRIEHAHLTATAPAAELHQYWVLLIRQCDDFVCRRLDRCLRGERVFEVDQLDLPNHHRVVSLRRDASRQRAFRNVARCGDD